MKLCLGCVLVKEIHPTQFCVITLYMCWWWCCVAIKLAQVANNIHSYHVSTAQDMLHSYHQKYVSKSNTYQSPFKIYIMYASLILFIFEEKMFYFCLFQTFYCLFQTERDSGSCQSKDTKLSSNNFTQDRAAQSF